MKYKNLNKLNSEISKLTILKLNLHNKLKEIELSILKSNSTKDLPRDTSKLQDEFIIKFVEKRDSINEQIKNIDKEISEINSHIDCLTNTISKMPDCFFKKIMDMFYLKSKTINEIVCSTGYSRSHVYNVIHSKGGDY